MTDHEAQEARADMAEIARLTTEVRGLRAALEQKERAIEAERRAREMALTDNIALLDALNRLMAFVTTARYMGDADRELINITLTDHHPGTSLLAELDAARAVVAAMREIDRHEVGAYEVTWSNMPEPCEACVEMREIAEQALKAYDAATKARGE